jgi:hypothetical protein
MTETRIRNSGNEEKRVIHGRGDDPSGTVPEFLFYNR